MKTEVLMQRELFGMPIHQKSKSAFFSATDLVKAGNAWRVKEGLDMFSLPSYLKTKSTKEFISELEKITGERPKINSRGKGQHTWVHPYLFIDIALAINPKLKVEVYSWLHDELLKYRNQSGDSYKKFAGAIFERIGRKADTPAKIKDLAFKLKRLLGVSDWESCGEDILKMRESIQDTFTIYTDVVTDVDEAFRLSLVRHGISKI